jgi:hypothetical protein
MSSATYQKFTLITYEDALPFAQHFIPKTDMMPLIYFMSFDDYETTPQCDILHQPRLYRQL